MADITFPTLDTAPPPAPPALLRTVLRENAVLSATSGAVLALGSPGLDSWLGLDVWLLVALGVGLVVYAAGLWIGADRHGTLEQTGKIAIVGDIGWVVGAIGIIAATSWLTRTGEIALAVVSVPVTLLAIGQIIGIRHLDGHAA